VLQSSNVRTVETEGTRSATLMYDMNTYFHTKVLELCLWHLLIVVSHSGSKKERFSHIKGFLKEANETCWIVWPFFVL
jgi:hypothetical protein